MEKTARQVFLWTLYVVDSFAAAQIPIVLMVHVTLGLFLLHYLEQNIFRALLSFVEQKVTTMLGFCNLK